MFSMQGERASVLAVPGLRAPNLTRASSMFSMQGECTSVPAVPGLRAPNLTRASSMFSVQRERASVPAVPGLRAPNLHPVPLLLRVHRETPRQGLYRLIFCFNFSWPTAEKNSVSTTVVDPESSRLEAIESGS
jgi:hypothetical protein